MDWFERGDSIIGSLAKGTQTTTITIATTAITEQQRKQLFYVCNCVCVWGCARTQANKTHTHTNTHTQKSLATKSKENNCRPAEQNCWWEKSVEGEGKWVLGGGRQWAVMRERERGNTSLRWRYWCRKLLFLPLLLFCWSFCIESKCIGWRCFLQCSPLSSWKWSTQKIVRSSFRSIL